MKHWDTVAIVGVGLIGGSIGLALRQRRLARRVVGIGRRESSLRKAKQRGAVDSTTKSLASGVAAAELVIVCTPVDEIVGHVCKAAEHCRDGTLITDAGSTKQEIVAGLDGELPKSVEFVGSHPLAGSHETGPEAARADLFEDRVAVVTPTRKSDEKAVDAIERFWTAIGATVVRSTPRAHDEAVAAISHLPHLVVAALARATAEKHLPLASTGWADTTRIAAGDPRMWQQILSSNRGHVLKSLDKFEKVLASFRAALERGETDQIEKLLAAGKRTRDIVGS